jgi:hypothetical protein
MLNVVANTPSSRNWFISVGRILLCALASTSDAFAIGQEYNEPTFCLLVGETDKKIDVHIEMNETTQKMVEHLSTSN